MSVGVIVCIVFIVITGDSGNDDDVDSMCSAAIGEEANKGIADDDKILAILSIVVLVLTAAEVVKLMVSLGLDDIFRVAADVVSVCTSILLLKISDNISVTSSIGATSDGSIFVA